jgi:hypothetical protein
VWRATTLVDASALANGARAARACEWLGAPSPARTRATSTRNKRRSSRHTETTMRRVLCVAYESVKRGGESGDTRARAIWRAPHTRHNAFGSAPRDAAARSTLYIATQRTNDTAYSERSVTMWCCARCLARQRAGEPDFVWLCEQAMRARQNDVRGGKRHRHANRSMCAASRSSAVT